MRSSPALNEPKAFQNENRHPMAGVKCFECGQMGHFAKKCPSKKPVVVQAMQVKPDELVLYIMWGDGTPGRCVRTIP